MASADVLRYFEDQAFDLSNAIVVVDVDGTIVPDCGQTVSAPVRDKIAELKVRGNELWICSNSRRTGYAARLAAIAAQLDVRLAPASFRKPNPLALRGIERAGRTLVIIGDKDLTDGMLARWSGARFIKVRRMVDPADRPVSYLTSLFDDVFWPIVLFLWDSIFARATSAAAR
jgi:HAD superfamily phosphatase (TIGR01668 family)